MSRWISRMGKKSKEIDPCYENLFNRPYHRPNRQRALASCPRGRRAVEHPVTLSLTESVYVGESGSFDVIGSYWYIRVRFAKVESGRVQSPVSRQPRSHARPEPPGL
jgi:hypothetical protein